jgi:hypothetical protein
MAIWLDNEEHRLHVVPLCVVIGWIFGDAEQGTAGTEDTPGVHKGVSTNRVDDDVHITNVIFEAGGVVNYLAGSEEFDIFG